MSVTPFAPPKPRADTVREKVKSLTRAHEAIYERIAAMQGEPKGESFVFVFEDDIALNERAQDVLSTFQRAASLTLLHSLPLFYAGICGPKWSGTSGRASGRCSHAYAVLPSRAKWLLDATRSSRGSRGPQPADIDIRLELLAQRQGGYFVTHDRLRSPQCWSQHNRSYFHCQRGGVGHFGTFYQDRSQNPPQIH
jgi:GR25 family glycosyltransferase involved in LPS biosynthesis